MGLIDAFTPQPPSTSLAVAVYCNSPTYMYILELGKLYLLDYLSQIYPPPAGGPYGHFFGPV